MSESTDLLRPARRRAEALRSGYRSAGFWSAQPVDVVRTAAVRHPARLAVQDRRVELTFAELDARVDGAVQEMAEAGVAPSAVVVVVAGNDVDSVVAVHALVRLDAVALLVPRSAGPAQVAAIIERTHAAFGVAPNWGAVDEPELCALCTWITPGDAASAGGRPTRLPRRPADEPSLVIYTSGTTSAPKGVIHSLSTLIKASSNYIAATGLTAADTIFLISPLASVTGVLQAMLISPMLGAPVVLEDRWDPGATGDFLVSTGATWYGGPDRLLDRLLDEPVLRHRALRLQAVYLGGTQLDRRIVARIEDEFGIVVMRAYGSSEAPISTSGRRGEPARLRHADDGQPLRDVEIKVGSAIEPTECCIRGPHTFLGYTDPVDDEQAFDSGWYRTGDVAELADGRLRIVGRLRDIVIRNGLNISLAEVEGEISRIVGVCQCAAFSVADPATGERLAAALVLVPGADMSLAEMADALIAAGLPKYKLPEELVFWDQPLPANANGKIDRNALRTRSQGRPRELAARLVLSH